MKGEPPLTREEAHTIVDTIYDLMGTCVDIEYVSTDGKTHGMSGILVELSIQACVDWGYAMEILKDTTIENSSECD